jgi:hypothetical protein
MNKFVGIKVYSNWGADIRYFKDNFIDNVIFYYNLDKDLFKLIENNIYIFSEDNSYNQNWVFIWEFYWYTLYIVPFEYFVKNDYRYKFLWKNLHSK